MSKEKKYSLISLDTGEEERVAGVDEQAGVKTSRSFVDGEETIVVSSSPKDSMLESSLSIDTIASERKNMDATDDLSAFGSNEHADAEVEVPLETEDLVGDDAEEIPFKRMQGIIIGCLIVLMLAFLVYFNFLR